MDDQNAVHDFYDATGDTFDDSYNWEGSLYPSNRIRADICHDQLAKAGVHRVLDAGCGTGIILLELLQRGYDAEGFDFSEVAVAKARERLKAAGVNRHEARVWTQDMAGGIKIGCLGGTGNADAVIIMGAFTHPFNHANALSLLHECLKPGGLLLVELRNSLFNLFTANEYTVDFMRAIMPPGPLADRALADLAERTFRRAPIQGSPIQDEHEKFFSVPSVWRNPLTVDAEYRSAGFDVIDKLGFHWHAVPPTFEHLDPAAFRAASLALERYPHDWRWHFMASAFILVARAR